MQIIKSILLWLLGVVLGVAVLLGAVMAASYSFTTSGSAPDPAVQFGGQALEVNGSCWQVPLIGGLLDKAFYAPSTLSVQKLGVLYEAHPELTLPDWATGAQLTITADGMGDAYYFQGDLTQYAGFLYPANGEYKAQLTVWRLPEGMTDADFRWPSDGAVLRNAGLERPSRPTGCYQYSFRFTIQASAQLELSAERIAQGGVAALEISGMVGSETPVVETDLGSVQCVRSPAGWRCYIPAAYNASAGSHTLSVTVNGETLTTTLVVTAQNFGEAEAQPDPPAPEGASEEFRNVIWPLYEDKARDKMWQGAFLCPLENYTVLLDYGQTKVMGGARAGQSNSTLLYAVPGDAVRAPGGRSPGPGRRGCGGGPEPGPHRQHGGDRPRLRPPELPLRPVGHPGPVGPDRLPGGRGGPGGGDPHHGLQAGEQEHQPLAPVPDQRRAVLAGVLSAAP